MADTITGKPQLNREVNRRLILDRIRRAGEVSRAELAKITSIRPPTVSAVIRELLDEGLVEETGAGAPSGGRAPRMVALRRKHPRALGFEVSETEILAGVCDLAGDIRSSARVPFVPGTPDSAVEHLHAVGSKVLEELGLDWSGIQGVGVAVPGHMNSAAGTIRWSQPFGWRDIPLKALCEKRWGTPTDVVNDSLAGAMAAHFMGVAREVRNFVYLYLRFLDASHGVVGLGSGIIINGEPFHGEFGAAGEITTPLAHPIVSRNGDATLLFADVPSFLAAYGDNDPTAIDAMDRVADEFSVLVLHAINLLEPGMMVIDADVESMRDAMLTRLQRRVEEHRLRFEPGETRLVASSLGDFGVVRGAVVPTLQNVFQMPRWS